MYVYMFKFDYVCVNLHINLRVCIYACEYTFKHQLNSRSINFNGDRCSISELKVKA